MTSLSKLTGLLRSKVFITGFLAAYTTFFVLTLFIYPSNGRGFGVGTVYYGYPFTYYFSTCFSGGYLYTGLFGNILFAAVISLLMGMFATLIADRLVKPACRFVASEEFHRKWYL